MELAEALGVPSEIVEILSPKKIPGSEEVETTRVEVSKPEIALTAQEKRDLRIQELKSLGPIITFFSCFVPCVPSFPRFQTFYDFVCPFPAHCSAAQAAVGAGQSPEDCNAGGWWGWRYEAGSDPSKPWPTGYFEDGFVTSCPHLFWGTECGGYPKTCFQSIQAKAQRQPCCGFNLKRNNPTSWFLCSTWRACEPYDCSWSSPLPTKNAWTQRFWRANIWRSNTTTWSLIRLW